MKKLLFAAFLPFLLTTFSPLSLSSETRVYKASSKQVMRYYDDTKSLDFTDSTPEEISAYYGDIGSRKGDDLLHYLYQKITPSEIQNLSDYSSEDNLKKISEVDGSYYLNYDGLTTDKKSVSAWYQITDRNWSKSYEITPTTFQFISSKDENAKNLYFYNMYVSDTSNNDTTKAFSNLVNSLKADTTTAAVDWEKRTRPSSFIQVDKEHVWAKNHGFKVKGSDGKDDFVAGAPTDLHHLVAADHNTNSKGHNDYFYGTVEHTEKNKIEAYLADGSTEVSGWNITTKGKETFEPTDEWKGDIARCLFYMATRYSRKLDQNCQAEPYLYITEDRSYTDDSNTIFHGVQYNLSTLLEWNKMDPVSDYERHRNNLIYKNVQNNRNPYVDHPEWVSRVFDKNWNGDTSGDNTSSSTTPTSDNNSSKDDTNNPSFSLFGLSEEQSMTVVIVIAIVILIIVILIIVLSQKGKKKKKRKPYKKSNKKSSSNRK